MFLYGLNPLLTPLVSTDNPANLDAAMERAKVVETGYNYIPTKQINVPAAIAENPTINATIQPRTTPKSNVSSPGSNIEALTQQMHQISLDYANLSAALLARTAQVIPTKPKGYRSEKPVKIITCYNCGHFARECPSQTDERPQKTTRFQTRSVNYLDCKYDTSEDEETSKVYWNTRSRSYRKASSDSSKEKRLQKRTRSRDELDEGDKEEVYIPISITKASASERRKTRRKSKLEPTESEKEAETAPMYHSEPFPVIDLRHSFWKGHVTFKEQSRYTPVTNPRRTRDSTV